MFLLFFGAVSLGMGVFTTYFGVKKSRVIGVLLFVLGSVVLLTIYWMIFQDETIDSEIVAGSLVSVLAAAVGAAIALGFVVLPMVFGSKEQIDEVESLAGTMEDARDVATPELAEPAATSEEAPVKEENATPGDEEVKIAETATTEDSEKDKASQLPGDKKPEEE